MVLNRAHYQQQENTPSKRILAGGVTFDLQSVLTSLPRSRHQ